MTAETLTPQAVVRSLAGTHELGEPPDIYQVFGDFCRNPIGDTRASWLLLAGMVSTDGPIATDLFLVKAAEAQGKERAIKDWAYRVAVEFVGARKSEQRKRSLVESYRVDWGHQAARDGLALALWGIGENVVCNSTGGDKVPGICERAARFKCGKQAYQRVRDEVTGRANDAITEAAFWLEMCRAGNFSGEFRKRYELKTGVPYLG